MAPVGTSWLLSSPGRILAGVSHLQPMGLVWPRMAVSAAQHKIIHLLKTLCDFFCDHVTMYLMCSPKQHFFFQCGPETPKGWTPRLEKCPHPPIGTSPFPTLASTHDATHLGLARGSGSFRAFPTGFFSASSAVTRWNSASTFPCRKIKASVSGHKDLPAHRQPSGKVSYVKDCLEVP